MGDVVRFPRILRLVQIDWPSANPAGAPPLPPVAQRQGVLVHMTKRAVADGPGRVQAALAPERLPSGWHPSPAPPREPPKPAPGHAHPEKDAS